MSPADIDQVTRTWSVASVDIDSLRRALAARLHGSAAFRLQRADWIIGAVSALTPALARPTAFGPIASELVAVRCPVTMDELTQERDALLGALAERCGRLTQASEHAWRLAIGLFAEIVASSGLDPFGASDRVEPNR